MKTVKSLELGEIVFSTAGRDSGRFYIVVEIIDENYVSIADGDLRRIESPKKKKIKHLKTEGIIIEKIKEKIELEKKIFDAEIKSALRSFNGSI
ncbi:MAG: 50S ribosomal protein L14e [Firmicutes bacterium ADurb.Bin080]|jgi:large subunit ribosomal protein L14e|nr:RNA-binding protein [Clostridiales bacterium]OQC15613.1 MAG: 50S ribosomal protein L14e [Firmicutes bacterium ADurb.Bin080]